MEKVVKVQDPQQAPKMAVPQSRPAAMAAQILSKPQQAVLKKLPFSGKKMTMTTTIIAAVVTILVILAGIGSGWLLAGGKVKGQSSSAPSGVAAPGAKEGAQEAGLADEDTFRDSAEGVLEEGGIDGEGTHHLVREGGESQNVYLTSTVIDLGSFGGKKVKVWGETIAARKAGWLMDVGKIKVVE
jgi:hypothetical protein